MSVRASISKGYIWRPGLIGLVALAASGWFLYDGTVKYPRQQRMWKAYNEIIRQYVDDPNEGARLWEEMAAAEGWSSKKPVEKTDTDIMTQKIIAGITAPAGLFFCFVFVTSRGRWIEADEQGLTTSTGQRSSYGSITSVDKSRWQSKGIAVVHFDGDGQAGRIVLDDWKYDREPIKQILSAVQDRTGLGDDAEKTEANAVAADEPDEA
jgi:hypothetical protein